MIIKLDQASRILIPKILRKALEIKAGDEIKIELSSKKLIITKNDFYDENKKCDLCGEPIGDFTDNGIYEDNYCEECFKEAEESRL